MKVTLIEAPICKGSPTDGSQYAYRALTEAGVASYFDDVVLSPMEPPVATGESVPNMKDVGEVMAVCRELSARVGDAIREGRLPIVVGGDHSVAIGSLAGAASALGVENLAVVYIDGHTDINTDKTTETGFIHGMPLAAAMGLCDERLTVGNRVNLKGENTFILGARSVDEGEYPIIASQGVTLFTADAIRTKGIETVVEEVLKAITAPAIHVSFDVDFLDQAVFPSTGYRMPDGLALADAAVILTACFATGRICSLDVVEYNPLLDTDGRDREKLFLLLEQIVQTERKVLS
jgi:arginase